MPGGTLKEGNIDSKNGKNHFEQRHGRPCAHACMLWGVRLGAKWVGRDNREGRGAKRGRRLTMQNRQKSSLSFSIKAKKMVAVCVYYRRLIFRFTCLFNPSGRLLGSVAAFSCR